MKRFIRKYLDPNKELNILEVGSMDVHNPKKQLVFKRYLNNPKWKFTGLDLAPGNNVDIVANGKYEYPFWDEEFDVVISGNTLEHVEDTHEWIKEVARVSKDLVCIIAPNNHPYHCYPIDCWRVFPDGMRFLLNDIAGMDVLECKMDGGKTKKDTVGIAKKRR